MGWQKKKGAAWIRLRVVRAASPFFFSFPIFENPFAPFDNSILFQTGTDRCDTRTSWVVKDLHAQCRMRGKGGNGNAGASWIIRANFLWKILSKKRDEKCTKDGQDKVGRKIALFLIWLPSGTGTSSSSWTVTFLCLYWSGRPGSNHADGSPPPLSPCPPLWLAGHHSWPCFPSQIRGRTEEEGE